MCTRVTGDDLGETLVEVLVAVVILGLAGVAVMAGLGMAVESSDVHRKETNGSAYVKSFAEAIQKYVGQSGVTNYKQCAVADYYTSRVTLALPFGYTASQEAAQSLGPSGAVVSPCADQGLQRLKLHVKSNDGRADESLTIVLRNPCAPSVSSCTA